MKKILTIALLLIAINAQGQGLPVTANATLASLFPDENLRRVVAEVLGNDARLTGQALSDSLARVKRLEVAGPYDDLYARRYLNVYYDNTISNSSGIEYLIGLTVLILHSTNLTNMTNLCNLINLTNLTVSNNRLTSLDVSALTNLIELFVGFNELTSLDVSNLSNLETLSADFNHLTYIDISNLIHLETLSLSVNRLTDINLSNLPNLLTLNVAGNRLTNLDVRSLHNLEYLNIGFTGITHLNLRYNRRLAIISYNEEEQSITFEGLRPNIKFQHYTTLIFF
ncbi:MAG: hypothetical protein FWE37_08130 [Spirochaetaceae bacterium]|nr:hypothetical protein [Spirochaetaceae bacterium]